MKLLKCCWIREDLENYDNIDMLWFNFIESSKRYIDPEKASKIETPSSTLRVWVFWKTSPLTPLLKGEGNKWKDITKSELVDIILTAKKARMNAIQIHWNCDFAYLKLYNFLVIQSVSIEDLIIHHPSGASPLKGVPRPLNTKGSKESLDFYIIDWANPWSGNWYDYSKINDLNLEKNFLVAGGVNEENVWKIFEIFKENPFFCGVDIASWVDNWKNIDRGKVDKIFNLIK